jgi:hypothetical protein
MLASFAMTGRPLCGKRLAADAFADQGRAPWIEATEDSRMLWAAERQPDGTGPRFRSIFRALHNQRS